MDGESATLLLFLDLLVAFNTIDYDILLDHLLFQDWHTFVKVSILLTAQPLGLWLHLVLHVF